MHENMKHQEVQQAYGQQKLLLFAFAIVVKLRTPLTSAFFRFNVMRVLNVSYPV